MFIVSDKKENYDFTRIQKRCLLNTLGRER